MEAEWGLFSECSTLWRYFCFLCLYFNKLIIFHHFVDSFTHFIVRIPGSRHESNLLADIDARYGTSPWTYRP